MNPATSSSLVGLLRQQQLVLHSSLARVGVINASSAARYAASAARRSNMDRGRHLFSSFVHEGSSEHGKDLLESMQKILKRSAKRGRRQGIVQKEVSAISAVVDLASARDLSKRRA